MADQPSERRNSNTQLLQELEALSQSLYQSHTTRRTASLILPRTTAVPPPVDAIPSAAAAARHADDAAARSDNRSRFRRNSMSPWRSRPKQQHAAEHHDDDGDHHRQQSAVPAVSTAGEKKGIWNWKPMRALSHIGMHRLGCLFSVEVVSVQGLPASMNGLRLSVVVRKKETRDGALQTMPSRVQGGCADFEETLFLRCHVYCSGGAGTGKPLKFEPRPFLVSAIAVDAPELDFGRSTVDISLLVKESMEKSLEGSRIRQWDTSFHLAGKAKGGELDLKLGFQIMEDGGVGIYSQAGAGVGMINPGGAGKKGSGSSSPFVRKQSKNSFSVTSPKVSSRLDPTTSPSSSKEPSAVDYRGIDDFNLDEPVTAPTPPSISPSVQKSEPDVKMEDLDLPEFEVVDKGVEVEEENEEGKGSEDVSTGTGDDEKSVSGEVIVKEVVVSVVGGDHHRRLTELDSIAQQIKVLESMMVDSGSDSSKAAAAALPEREPPHGLDADEETVTKEFLQMLELEEGKEFSYGAPEFVAPMKSASTEVDEAEGETKAFVSDLGKGLGSVVQTKDGGYLAATNPLDVEVPRKETPKLAMQISKPLVLRDQKSASGFEIFQRMAAMGAGELCSELVSLTAMDDLTGKAAEQIAFEGIASAIINGRNNKEGASSSAARSIAAVKTMAAAMGAGRKERILTGIWNVGEEPVGVEDILAFALQKIEAMAVEALKVQADMAEEEAPFDVFTLAGKGDPKPPLASAASIDEWAKNGGGGGDENSGGITMLVVVQLRDPLRRFEKVGAPVIALVQAAAAEGDGEEKFKVTSMHVGGVKARGKNVISGCGGGGWDGEKQRLTALQWLVAYGLGKQQQQGKKVWKSGVQKGGGGGQQDLLWSMSSRVMADMWLKPMRNPDVKFPGSSNNK